ncbi:MAG TPA: hypothetical protein VNT31_01710 [Nocardioides sp.]|nr:hypothetical protein [Nocardioides sp.]
MISGVAHLDLSRADDSAVLAELCAMPDGARVIVQVGARCGWTMREIELLSRNGRRLHLEIHGTTAAAVEAWVRALR